MNIQPIKRRTKVIWSLDSQILDDNIAEKTVKAEIDALRLVYSKDSVQTLSDFIEKIRIKRKDNPRNIPLMIDVTSNCRANAYNVKDPKELVFGETIKITEDKSGDISIKTNEWENLFAEDASIFFGFGDVALKAKRVTKSYVEAEVVQGGTIYDNMELHVPVTKAVPTLADLSHIDVKTFKNSNIDYVIIPGMESAREVNIVRKRLSVVGEQAPWLIAKVDRKEVYQKIDELLPVVDGIMISRRELALTLEPALIPMVSKEIIQKCNNYAKLVFVASEMLGSMRYNPTPTRAEVSDIANAVMDGADAIILSEEVSRGKHPIKSLEVAYNAIEDLEKNDDVALNWLREAPVIANEFDAVAYQAYQTAERLGAKAVVCITKTGNTALKLASFRTSKPIIAVTFDEQAKNRMSLIRGVEGVVLDIDPTLDEVLPTVNDLLIRSSWLEPGDLIVFVTVTISPVGREASNLFTVQRLE